MTCNRTRIASVATALCAIGSLTMPGSAYARPPVPLAPFCGGWAIPAGTFVINQDNGIQVEMDGWDGPAPSQQRIQYKLNYSLFGQPPAVTTGTVTDGAIDGNTIHFKADWDPHPGSSDWNQYTGTIDDNGYASGTTYNDGQKRNSGNRWGSVAPLTCVGSPGVPWMPPIVTS